MSLIKRLFVFSLVVTTVLWSFDGVSVKAAGSYGAGSLLALEGVSGAAVYYIGSDGMKYVFPDGKTYATWYNNFDDVVRVPVSELDMYVDGGAVTYRPGTKLVTHENTAKIYAVSPGGVLHWIPSAAVAEDLYGANWASMVMDVIPGYFSSSYTTGSDLSTMYPTGTLLKMGSDYYYVEGTDVRPFADADAFEANGFWYSNAIEVSDLSAYGTGESITGEEMALSGFMPGEDSGPVVTPGGDLSVSLASTSPASRTIISDTASIGEALVDFTHLRFTASNSGAVTVDTLKLTRSGISSDSDLDTVYLFDGMTRIADGGSISSGVVTFNDPSGLFTVPAGSSKVISVRGDVAAGLGAGKTIAFSLNSASDVTLDGTGSVGGSLPATGNLMSTASVTDLGYLTVATSSAPATTDVGVDSNQEDIEVWSFNLTANDQKMWVERIVVTEVGSIQSDDLQNFRLLANGVEVGTATMANDYTLTFDLSNSPMEITSGSTKTMSLRADIVKGSTKTFYFSFQYMADVVAMDKTYNVYAPFYPSYSVGTWAIVKPDGNYKVNSGTVTVSRSSDSPTGTLAVNTTNVTLAKFDFKASGEDMKIKNLDVQVNVTAGTNGGVDNGKVFVDGVQVGSTKDLTEATDVNFTFGSSFVIPAGTTKVVSIVGDTKTTTGTAFNGSESAVVVTVGAGSSNAQGMTSLQTTSVPSSDTNGNTLSASADSLTISKYSGYGDQTFVAGTNMARLGSFVLNTGSASGVVVNSITVVLSTDEAASVSNMYLMSNGEQFGSTKASPSTSNVFSDSVTIAKSGAQVFDIYADLSSNADAGSWIANVAASGNSTPGNSSVSASAVNVQTITVGTGTLSASNGSHPDSAIVLASTADNYFAEYRFSAANEAYTITKMLFTTEAGFATSTAGVTLEYTNTDGVTEQVDGIFINSGGTYYATFTGLDMRVPKDDEATVKVYVDTTSVASGADSGATGKMTFVYNSGFEAIGTSGTTKTSAGSANLNGNTFYLRKSVPTFAKLASQNTTPVTGQALFKFSVVADAKGAIDIKQLGFTLTTSGVTVTSMKLYKSDSGTALTDTGVDGNNVKLLVGAVDDDVENVNTTTKYYEVRGTVTGWGQSGDQITIGFKEDTAAAVDAAANTQNGSYYNVWSDRSATSHTTVTADWTNGYLLKQMDTSHDFNKS